MSYSIFKVEVFDPSGNLVADLTGLETNKQVGVTRNDADTLQCTFGLDALRAYAFSMGTRVIDILSVNLNELRISRVNASGTWSVVSAGQIISLVRKIDGSNRTVTVSAVGWFGLLARRYTIATYSYLDGMTDGGQIAKTLIQDAQAVTHGNLGITIGTIQPSWNLPVAYDLFKRIKDAISEMSAMYNSFDFEITWDKVFNVYYPGIGAERPDLPIVYPGNVKSLTLTLDGTVLANEVIAEGSGSGTARFIADSNDAVSQSVYGLRTSVVLYNDIYNLPMLQARSDADVITTAKYVGIPEVVLDGNLGYNITQIKIGDRLPFMVDPEETGLEDLSNYYRVESMQWTVNGDTEELKLVMSI